MDRQLIFSFLIKKEERNLRCLTDSNQPIRISQFSIVLPFFMPFHSFFFCVCEYCRHVDTSGGEHVFGRSDRIPERSRGDELAEYQAGDEHLLRPAAHRQHVRGVWQVECSLESLGSSRTRYLWIPDACR